MIALPLYFLDRFTYSRPPAYTARRTIIRVEPYSLPPGTVS